MQETKCPVCGKPGIPDYHREDIVCPQCKSDLSIFRVIDKINNPDTGGKNKWKLISAVAILVTAVFGLLLVLNLVNGKDANQSNELSLLNDSISHLRSEIQNISSSQVNSAKFTYVVRKGDSYWSISQKFYGDGCKAETIAKNNNRTIDSSIHVGDTLEIFQ